MLTPFSVAIVQKLSEELALKLKPVIAEIAKENQRMGAEMTNTGLEISPKAINTREEVAHAAGVSHDTIAKVKKIEAVASPEVRIGELTAAMPKARGNQYTKSASPARAEKQTTKAEAKAEARENDDIVSRSEASHWCRSPATLRLSVLTLLTCGCDSPYQPAPAFLLAYSLSSQKLIA